MIVSMTTVRAKHRGHWFDPDTLRFFRSHLPREAWRDGQGRYWFVTSEQDRDYVYSDGTVTKGAWDGRRLYTIRRMEPDGSVETIHPSGTLAHDAPHDDGAGGMGAFGYYASRSGAKAAMWRLIRADA